MPELPEVETIRQMVETHLTGHTVTGIDVSLLKLLRQSRITEPAVLVGRAVIGARRRGKVLDIRFTGDLDVLVHFKLAGQLAIDLPDGRRYVAGHPVPKFDGEMPHKATHAKITFEDGRIAWYSDIRQFGWLNILPSDDVPAVLEALTIGPEATEPIDIERLAATRGVRVRRVDRARLAAEAAPLMLVS